jgi:hypothetical protein
MARCPSVLARLSRLGESKQAEYGFPKDDACDLDFVRRGAIGIDRASRAGIHRRRPPANSGFVPGSGCLDPDDSSGHGPGYDVGPSSAPSARQHTPKASAESACSMQCRRPGRLPLARRLCEDNAAGKFTIHRQPTTPGHRTARGGAPTNRGSGALEARTHMPRYFNLRVRTRNSLCRVVHSGVGERTVTPVARS